MIKLATCAGLTLQFIYAKAMPKKKTAKNQLFRNSGSFKLIIMIKMHEIELAKR